MTTLERVPIADILIGERRRHDLGDIAGLATNIDEHGLLHPIIIADDNGLIAGERRLRACQSLGHTDILVRRWPDLTEAERRELELAENLNRKDLTAIERSRQMVRLAETAEEVLAESAKTSPSLNGGRPTKRAVSEQAVADRIGVPRKTLNDATRHVAAVEHYPELEHLSQAEALELAATLPTLPEEEQTALRDALVASNKVPTLEEAAYAVADEAGKSELDRIRYLRRLSATLSPLAKLAAQFDPADVAMHIDEDYLHYQIDIPLGLLNEWAELVRGNMQSGLRMVKGGRT